MPRFKKFLALMLCLVLFTTALMLSFFLSRDDVGDFHGDGTGHIVLSEILPSNRTYPNRAGQYLDYIELRNLTDSPVDISAVLRYHHEIYARGDADAVAEAIRSFAYDICHMDAAMAPVVRWLEEEGENP